MSQLYSRSLFLFHRDLRLDDNTGLNAALASSREVLCCFILDPQQLKNNPYKSESAVQFMLESLLELSAALKKHGGRLYIFMGPPVVVMERLIEEEKIEAVFFDRDVTPFSMSRDLKIETLCGSKGIACQSYDDVLLTAPGSVMKQAGGPYTVFTPFFKKAQEQKIAKPAALIKGQFVSHAIKGDESKSLKDVLTVANPDLAVRGGRAAALSILKDLKQYQDYAKERDIPSQKGTTRLSAHLKFGTVSVREAYHAITSALGKTHPLIRQLYWRDFFSHIAYHFPHVFGHCFYQQYDTLPWSQDEAYFTAWCSGQTGFPIVDAGMRELNKTGLMHNRVRMIAASFLVKDLHIDWRKGERYFAQKLVDYDPAVNNGNWQWVASTGCDHQPYFRIFNPGRQQERFDPECVYIKRWVPELKALSPKTIHALYEEGPVAGYSQMIVDHACESEKAKAIFKR